MSVEHFWFPTSQSLHLEHRSELVWSLSHSLFASTAMLWHVGSRIRLTNVLNNIIFVKVCSFHWKTISDQTKIIVWVLQLPGNAKRAEKKWFAHCLPFFSAQIRGEKNSFSRAEKRKKTPTRAINEISWRLLVSHSPFSLLRWLHSRLHRRHLSSHYGSHFQVIVVHRLSRL